MVMSAFSFDKKYPKDDSLLWSSHYEVPYILGGALVATAFIEGSESRFGQTSWRALESLILTQIATAGIKKITGRKRPRDTDSS